MIKWDTFAGACALDVLEEIRPRITCPADRAIPDSPNDLLEPLLLPGAVVRIPESYDFLDEVVEAADLGGGSPGDGFHGRDDFVRR